MTIDFDLPEGTVPGRRVGEEISGIPFAELAGRAFLAGMLAGSNAIDAASGASAVFIGNSFLIGFD